MAEIPIPKSPIICKSDSRSGSRAGIITPLVATFHAPISPMPTVNLLCREDLETSPQSSRVTATLREAGLRKNEAAFHATSAQTLRTAPLSTRRGHLCPCPPPPPGLQVSLCPHLHQSYGLSADGRGTVRPTLGRGGKAQRDIGVPKGRRLLLSTVNAASRVLTYV